MAKTAVFALQKCTRLISRKISVIQILKLPHCKYGLLDLQHGLFDFKHGLLDFKHGLLDFKHGLLDFKHGLLDFKHAYIVNLDNSMK